MVIEVPSRFDGLVAAYLALIVPVVAQLSGQSIRTIQVPLARKIASAIGMTELVLLRDSPRQLEPMAVGDVTLTAIAQADIYCFIPAGAEGHAAGELITAIRLDDPFGPNRPEQFS